MVPKPGSQYFHESFHKSSIRPTFEPNFKLSHIAPNHQVSNIKHASIMPFNLFQLSHSIKTSACQECFHLAPSFIFFMLHIGFLESCLKFDEKFIWLALRGPYKYAWMIIIDWIAQNHSDWKITFATNFKISNFINQWFLLLLIDQMVLVCHV